MTDLKLQQVIIDEIRTLLDNHSIRKLDGEEWTDFHVYCQDKPYKDDEEDDQEDYIIVMLDDEDLGADGRWKVNVHILISICLYEEEHQGNMILADLMNQIYMHFQKKGFIGGMFEMESEAHKRFNQESYPNYYECDLITVWKLPEIYMETEGDLI